MTHASENRDSVLELGAAGQDENRKPWYRQWWVALIGLVVVAGVIGGVVAYANAQSLSRQRVAYQEAVDQARQAFDELNEAVGQAQVRALDCAEKTGQDASCDGLAQALTDLPVAVQFADGSELGRAELEAGKTEAEMAAQVARERAGLLSERSEAVRVAVVAFELRTAQETLATSIEQASTARDQAVELISQTQGKVVDDGKRGDLQQVVDGLSGLIDAAGQVSGEDPEPYRDMVTQLDQAVARLNERVGQVKDAHQAFLAQASAQAQAEAQSSQSASSGGQNSNRSSRSQAPARQPAPAPAPQRPAPAPAPAPQPAAPSAPAGGGWVDTSEGPDLCFIGDEFGNTRPC